MLLPRRIRPNPIVDSIVEIRFNPLIDRNAVFGVIYYALRNKFPRVESLPIQQLPDHIRSGDPLFAFRPEYRISNDKFLVQIGSDVISVSVIGEYPSWGVFSTTIIDVFSAINDLNIIGDVQRIGLRYISFFEGNLLDGKLKLNVSVPGYESGTYPANLLIELKNDQFVNVLRLTNNATVQTIGSDKTLTGSFVDIDTSINFPIVDFFGQMNLLLNKVHDSEKSLFYNLLTDEFLSTLNPEY